MLFLQTGSPAKSLSTKTVILSTCFCLRNPSAALGFPTRYRAARFSGIKSNSRGGSLSSFSWPNASQFLQGLICLGPKMKVSYKPICIVLLLLSLESDSVFLLTPVCLAVSLSWCAHCFNVRIIASGWTDDEWSVSQIRFNAQVLSNLINSNSEYTIQQ